MLLLVTYTLQPQKRTSFLQDVQNSQILEQIRKEDGCLRYEYYLHVEKDDQILLVEEWASKEQQQIHLQQSPMQLLKVCSVYRYSHAVVTSSSFPKMIHARELIKRKNG